MRNLMKMLLAGLICGFAAVSVKAAGSAQDVVSYPLLASKVYNAGTVTVWHDDDTLYIKYQTTNGWILDSTAVAVARDLSGFPKSGSNPSPGQFPYVDKDLPAGTTTKIYTISLNVLNLDHMLIATHADVKLSGVNDCDDTDTAWAGNQQFPGSNWAKYFAYNIVPNWLPEE